MEAQDFLSTGRSVSFLGGRFISPDRRVGRDLGRPEPMAPTVVESVNRAVKNTTDCIESRSGPFTAETGGQIG